MVSKTSSLHSRLVGNLNFMAQAIVNPGYIQEAWRLARNTELKDGKIVHTHYFVDPETGTLVPTSLTSTSFLGLNGAGRPRCTRLWENVDALFKHMNLSDEVGYTELPTYNEILVSVADVATSKEAQDLLDDETTTDDIRDAIKGAREIVANYEQFSAPINREDILSMFSEETCTRRYRMFKIDAGMELIKALKLLRHPGARKNRAKLFTREIAPINPKLAEVLRKLTK